MSKEYRKLAKRANQRMVRLERYSERPGYSGVKSMAYRVAQQEIHSLYGKSGSNLRYTENPKLIPVSDGSRQLSGQDLAKANVKMMRAKLASLDKFLSSTSSTIADIYATDKSGKRLKDKEGKFVVAKPGLASTYDKRTESIKALIKEKFEVDIDLSAEDLKRFFDSKKQAKLQSLVGSDAMFVVAAIMKDKQLASNKRDLTKFFQDNIDIEFKMSDFKGKSAGEMFETLSNFIELTGNKVLDDYVTEAIKAGLNYKNLFI